MNYDSQVRAYLALATRRELSPSQALDLLTRAESPMDAWEAYRQEHDLAKDLPDRLINALIVRGWDIITPISPQWNPLLSKIHHPPLYLYARGNVELLRAPCVAMVGSRSATETGRAIAHKMAGELTQAGWVIVSGMALGLDGAAHRGALAAGGKTIAVLGTGLDICYPPAHEALMEEIGQKGLLITERPPGSKPLARYFPQRNRIVAGLSQGVVVIEAGAHSGARITANLALEEGRELMAVPCTPGGDLSYTPNQILQDGGHPVTCAADVMDILARSAMPQPKPNARPRPRKLPQEKPGEAEAPKAKKAAEPKAKKAAASPAPQTGKTKKAAQPKAAEKTEAPAPLQAEALSPEEQAVLARLKEGQAHFDELAELLDIQPGKLAGCMTLLKARNLIRVLPGLVYEINS